MEKAVRKLFGGIDLTWPKVIIAAVIAGVYTAAVAIIPAAQNTSFHTITVTFEVWILFGILIIMNSRSNIDSALKCFVFFLISQPLVYLIQVPFSWQGWGLFKYYRFWFAWTVFCLPMGFIGYYMKKGKWWGYLILFPMIVLTGLSYLGYFADFLFYMPRYILITLFCALVMVFYPVFIFENEKIRRYGAVIGLAMVLAATGVGLMNPPVYSTEILGSDDDHAFDDTCEVSLADERLGSVRIIYEEDIDVYMVHADFKRAGETVMTLTCLDGETREYDVVIERSTYEVKERQ